ncbi:MAG TPA: protein kinase [Pirellulales bacterium]|nr:protein kinase [Pirellulales bacterium]
MNVTLESVVSQLSASGIVAPSKLERLLPPHAHPRDIGELVDSLVKQGLLTQFQARQIKAGKLKALLLGAYTLLDKLGAGGMGQVFKAEHRRMKRLVAVKMLPAGLMKDAAAIARFEREVEAAAKLEHPNIVTAYDANQAGGVHFLVMQFVDGVDLSALVKKNGPLPIRKAVDYILQAARGLKFAHDKGVVHRDVKPANLLLGKDGIVRILDMGLARIDVDGESSTQIELTETGAVMGTVDYMAPDQALDIRRADARADIYSLGCTLYYLVTGKPMYDAPSLMGKLLAHRDQPIPSLVQTQTAVPPQLDAIYQKMVAKHVADRYQSMSEVIEALERLGLTGSEGSAPAERASAVTLSADERKMLTVKPSTAISSLSKAVASEKTKHLLAKVVGGVFATIIAPILVAYLIKYLEREDSSSGPTAAVSASPTRGDNVTSSADETKAATPLTPIDRQSPTIPERQPGDKTGWQGWPPEAPPPAIAPFNADQAQKHQEAWARYLGVPVEYQNPLGMKFRLIPPGEFTMGTPREATELLVEKAQKVGRWLIGPLQSEGLPRPVVIRQPFYLGAVEVTNEQFTAFRCDRVSDRRRAERPGWRSL